MPKRATTSSKRPLDDPGDVSISCAPTAPKKTKAKGPVLDDATGLPVKATRSAIKKTIPTAEIIEPESDPAPAPPPPPKKKAPKAKQLAPPAELKPTPESKATPAPATGKKKAKLVAEVTTSEAVQPGGAKEVVPPKAAAEKQSKRDKKPSSIAQKVVDQKVAEQKVKDQKAEKKAKKEAKVVINETPEETEAFLRRMGMDQTQPIVTASNPTNVLEVPVPKPPAPKPPTVSRHKALDQLIHAHRPSPPPSTLSMVSVGSSSVSVTPSESISQVGSAPRDLPRKPPSNAQPTTQPLRSSLQIPPALHQLSREVTPAAPSIITAVDEDNSNIVLEPSTSGPFDFNELLKNLPPLFVCEIPKPTELPPPLHQVELNEEAKVDLSNLKGAARTKARRKQDAPTLDMIRECDRGVVKMACNEFEISIYTICAFPTDAEEYALAVRANLIACRRLGRNYAIPRDSVYTRMLAARIGPARNKILKCSPHFGLLDVYGVVLGASEQAVGKVQQEIADLLKGAMVYPIENRQVLLDKPYQNSHFDTILKAMLFASFKSKGCQNPQSFEVVSIPLMALLATGLTKMLQAYSTGRFQTGSDNFGSKAFGPIYRGHLVQLKEMVEKDIGGLQQHFKDMITRAKDPHKDAIARTESAASAQSIQPVPCVISASAVASFARRTASTQSTLSVSNSAPPSLIVSNTAMAPPPLTLQATMMGIVNNDSLSKLEKAKLLRLLFLDSDQPPEPWGGSSMQFYEGALTAVGNGGSDSEAEAGRAGVFLTEEQRTSTLRAGMGGDSDSGSEPQILEESGQGEEVDGALGVEFEPGVDVEMEGESADDASSSETEDGANATGDIDSNGEGRGQGNGLVGVHGNGNGNGEEDGEEDGGEDDEEDGEGEEASGAEDDALKSRKFFPIPENLSAPDASSDDDDSSDGDSSNGDGIAGAVPPVAAEGADTTMQSVDTDDE